MLTGKGLAMEYKTYSIAKKKCFSDYKMKAKKTTKCY